VNHLVPDSSVAVKWFVPEIHVEAANRLRSLELDFVVPGHFHLEIVSALLKKVRSADNELTGEEATRIVPAVDAIPVEIRPIEPLLPEAFGLALRYGRSVYDALYVVLALRERCQFVTADRKLYDATVGAFPDTLLWVEDIPVA
jgi:predicted nucleic acid-binding protein